MIDIAVPRSRVQLIVVRRDANQVDASHDGVATMTKLTPHQSLSGQLSAQILVSFVPETTDSVQRRFPQLSDPADGVLMIRSH